MEQFGVGKEEQRGGWEVVRQLAALWGRGSMKGGSRSDLGCLLSKWVGGWVSIWAESQASAAITS